MEKINDEQLKRELSFDLYGRYANIRDIINNNRKKNEKFRVLDVGGRGNLLKKFLPNDEVFYLDPLVESDDENFIKDDGCSMSLEAESFDWVTSADVFEHIPLAKREAFLNENIRVAKSGTILVAPFWSKEVEKAEINANENYKKFSGGIDHEWLREHIENGLPKEIDIENFLKNNKIKYQKLHNNRLFLWEILLGINFYIGSDFNEGMKEELERFNYFYNTEVFPFDSASPSYRKIYFIKKDETLIDMDIENRSMDDVLILDTIKRSIDLIAKFNDENKKFIKLKDLSIEQKNKVIEDQNQEIESKESIIQKIELDIAPKNKVIENQNQEIESKESIIQKIELDIEQKNKIIENQNQEIESKESIIQKKDLEINSKISEIEFMKSSRFWKIKTFYEKFKNPIQKSLIVLKEKGLIVFIQKAVNFLTRKVFFELFNKKNEEYQLWISKNEQFYNKKIKKEISNFKYKPKISVITPVYNIDSKWLDKCIKSVINQTYYNWELCLYDDASTKQDTIKCLEKWENRDSRIKICYGKKNQHVSGASNEALKLSSGEFVALLDNDDELSVNALYENIKVLNKNNNIDFIYSDEDKIDQNNVRFDPYFKPDWSLYMFLSRNYTCHLSVYRKSILNKINGFRKGYEGAQDYDLALRFIEKINHKNIYHIPKILYHWRSIPGSTSRATDSKNYAYVAGVKSLNDYIKRNNINAEIKEGIFLGSYRIERVLNNNLKVSIIIPTKDKIEYLKPCVLSILNKTKFDNFEIIILDTGSKEIDTKLFYESLKNNKKITIIDYPNTDFNFAEANNWASQFASGEYLLFLNNDTEVISSEWLGSMLEYAQLDNVGVVGAKLLFPNNTIQHMGITIGLRGGASHAGILFPENQLMGSPFFHSKDVVKNISAVTGACLLISKKLFNHIGGFDVSFKIAFNDTDLCLRIREIGYDVVYTPYAKLIHYESITFGRPYDNPNRSVEFFEEERNKFNNKWANLDSGDPFYNENLTLIDESLKLKI